MVQKHVTVWLRGAAPLVAAVSPLQLNRTQLLKRKEESENRAFSMNLLFWSFGNLHKAAESGSTGLCHMRLFSSFYL